MRHLTLKLASQIKCFQEAESDDARRSIANDVLGTFSARLAEEMDVKLLAKSLYEQWQELKRVRTTQGFISTNAKLTATTLAERNDDEALDFEEEISVVRECVACLKLEYRTEQKAREMIARFEATRTEEGSAEYVFRLTDDGMYTKDDEVDR